MTSRALASEMVRSGNIFCDEKEPKKPGVGAFLRGSFKGDQRPYE